LTGLKFLDIGQELIYNSYTYTPYRYKTYNLTTKAEDLERMNDSIESIATASKQPQETKVSATDQSFPMSVGVLILWLIFWPGLVAWWLLMSVLFAERAYTAAVIVGYALPTLYTAAAFIAARQPGGGWRKLLHFGTFSVLSLIFIGILIAQGVAVPLDDPAPYLGIAFIAFVMSLMQFPKAGLARYNAYRSSLFVGGVIFMPLFIYIAALLPNVPHTPALDKVYLFPLGLLGFWLSAAWLSIRATEGGYVPGLEIRPLFPFRPDYILPGGVLFVKGAILMGVGLMIAIMPQLNMPQWNWWGFVLAFWGIIAIIPLRGMYKMAKSRRLRMLGLGGTGYAHETVKGLLLFVGLLILLYGFVNAFFGTVPFETLGVEPEFNAFAGGTFATQAVAVLTLILAFLVLVPLRGWHKLSLLEGVETTSQLVIKQILLWLGTILLFISFIHLFNLPPIRGAGVMGFYPADNPTGFWVGGLIFLAGSILLLVLRPIALRDELEATMMTMVGIAADQSDERRRWMLEHRVKTLAAMPDVQRDQHVAWMAAGLNSLPAEKRSVMMETQMDILMNIDPQARRRIMAAMDSAIMGGSS
jgi:hypothetical protein